MNEKDNLKDNLIHKAQDKDKSFPKSRHFFFEDNSNTESIKNSEALSEYDDEIASEKDVMLFLELQIKVIAIKQ